MMPVCSTDDDYARYMAADEKECPLHKQALLVYEENYNRVLAEYEAHIQTGILKGSFDPNEGGLPLPQNHLQKTITLKEA
jgi:hypothetical protein